MSQRGLQLNDAEECKQCGSELDEENLSEKLDGLRDCDASHFNLCADCLIIDDGQCWSCDGDTFVPRDYQDEEGDSRPNICPQCRYEYMTDDYDPFDPGWRME